MPGILLAEIEDRSKGDALSKGVAILQLAWFVLQLVARYIQSLPITLLEIDTLAVAALTSTAYGWWWNKPKDVRYPCPVKWKAAAPPSKTFKFAYEYVVNLFLAGTILIHLHTRLDAERHPGGWRHYVTMIFHPFASLMGMDLTVSHGVVRSCRVPSLAGYGKAGRVTSGIILVIGCLSGMVFGGIHCVGWNFLFQTRTEQVLWRSASLVILSSPVFFVISYVFESFLIAILVGFAYIAARLTLLALMFLSFRSLPPGVYDTVDWTKFIPHL
jgi:hypothetical protein